MVLEEHIAIWHQARIEDLTSNSRKSTYTQGSFMRDRQQSPLSDTQPNEESLIIEAERTPEQLEMANKIPFNFETCFQGRMGMYGELQRVADYLDAHEGWFCRCAKPMKAEPLGENGYILTIGRFGSFGYEVEPKMGVVLLPSQEGVYLMHSVPVPDYTPPGYDIDYQASMTLLEVPTEEIDWAVASKQRAKIAQFPSLVTQVEWQLQLRVTVNFPKFIYKLPPSLIQNTGDRLLAQIVRQISPRLTYKVQSDFHRSLNLPLPPKQSRKLEG
ncbi:MAG: DUF1997 domain-containing protein [Cyanobacteriota bacterium]|nr:DUF1997 domain-containing protein [Cyanobacteriota bacterium]